MWLNPSSDLSIVAKKIVAVKAIDQMSSTVYTEMAQFEVPMPKDLIISLIESRIDNRSSMENVEKLLAQIYQGQATPRP